MPGRRRDQARAQAEVGAVLEQVAGFRDLQVIGRGGFSTVYRAHQERLDRAVALKVLAVEFVDAPVRRRFLREVRLAGRLTEHPNVVTVLEAGMTGTGRPYIAMEYFSRGSLGDRLAAEGPLPVPEVLDIGVKVAQALAAAHELDIVHRDVKPQNILISRYGEPALADFGTARLTAGFDLSMRTEALTPYHAAPEVLRGEQGGPLCDVYSLGSTLYHLLAGRPPYQDQGDGVAGLLLRAVSEAPPPIRRPEVGAAVLDVVLRAMAKAPGERYADAASFAVALRGLRDGGSVSAPVSEVGEPDPVESVMPAGFDGFLATPTAIDADTHPRSQLLPAEQPSPPQPTQAETETETKPRRTLIYLGVGLGCLIAIASPLLIIGPAHKPTPRAPSPTAGQRITPPPATVDPAAVRPLDVQATDQGSGVYLRWRLQTPNGVLLAVEAIPVNGRGQAQIVENLSYGTTSTLITTLNPSLGYCFLVGTVTDISRAVTNPAWSVPTAQACIRGASPGS